MMTEYLKLQAREVENVIDGIVSDSTNAPKELVEAMQYSLKAGGKRLRPIMLREAARACGLKNMQDTDAFAAAIEMIHTFSLIHDDLPALDNDDLRRGKPTNHKVFGDALAILAGDGLLSFATEIMSDFVCEHTEKRFARAQCEIIKRSGIGGMIGGETVDVLADKKGLDISNETAMTKMYSMKTCDLLIASLRAGAMIADADDRTTELFGEYGYNVGLAFQIIDDILDVVGDEKLLGKNVGSDEANGKPTYVSLVGLENARTKANELSERAKSIAKELNSDFFVWLAGFLLDRKY